MNFQFRINLARDEVARYHQQRLRLHIITTYFFVFGLLLLASFAVYLKRNRTIEISQNQMRVYAQNCEKRGITPERVKAMKAEVDRFKGQLDALKEVVRGSSSWASTLIVLADCYDRQGVRLRTVQGEDRGTTPLVRLEGISPEKDAVTRIAMLLRDLGRQEMLGLGRVVTIRKDEKEPRAVFEIEIPFGGLPAAPTPTPTPAPAKAKGAAKP